MLISTVQRAQRWPLPVAQDADLRTRLLAALHALEQTIAVVRALQTTIIWSMWMVQDPDASETEQLAALDRVAQHLARPLGGPRLARQGRVAAEGGRLRRQLDDRQKQSPHDGVVACLTQ